MSDSDSKGLPEFVGDPLIELLAIKLYEHDHGNRWPVPEGYGSVPWLKTAPEDREVYRDMARGNRPIIGP